MLGVLGGIVGAASPASAHPGENGRGGEHTNRYDAQGCQQGGHEARVEAETGRTLRNAGDCSSHTALGGTLAAASGQVTLTASSPYACAAPEGRCWGTLSVTGAPTGAEIQVISVTLGGAVSLPVHAPDGSYSGPADIVCDDADPQEQFQAVVFDTPLRSLPITGATC
jgi:hypothetical protein